MTLGTNERGGDCVDLCAGKPPLAVHARRWRGLPPLSWSLQLVGTIHETNSRQSRDQCVLGERVSEDSKLMDMSES